MKELVFTCPKCEHHELASVQRVWHTFIVERIFDGGELEYDYDNCERGDSEVERYQCNYCGYVLTDEDGEPIDMCDDVPKWIKNNIPKTDG